MSWTWAALMPHPPIIVPEVGKGREQEAAETLKGTRLLCSRLKELNAVEVPDILLLLSPHEPYVPEALFINSAATMQGSLSRFGAPGAQVAFESTPDDLDLFKAVLDKAGIPFSLREVPDITADHGAVVPLYYLASTFPESKLPRIILVNPCGLSPEQALQMGKALADFNPEKRWALLASGDLSHRLKPGAPAGFHEDGKLFDKAVVDALRSGDASLLTGLSPSVRKNAGECGLRPALVLLGLCAAPLEVFSYEGPFGVGYCTALCISNSQAAVVAPTPKSKSSVKVSPPETNGKTIGKSKPQVRIGKVQLLPKEREKPDLYSQAARLAERHANTADSADSADSGRSIPKAKHPYALLARLAVIALLEGKALPDTETVKALSEDESIWAVRKGCFVSIKNKDGSLRGCIGTFGPTQSDLSKEIIQNSIAASTRDPRFPAMKASELGNVTISVDVLNEPELLAEGMALDPAVWGVIVSKGQSRGLLLPDLPTVTSVARQVSIAAQKGGISDLTDARIHRFTISRYLEGGAEEGA